VAKAITFVDGYSALGNVVSLLSVSSLKLLCINAKSMMPWIGKKKLIDSVKIKICCKF